MGALPFQGALLMGSSALATVRAIVVQASSLRPVKEGGVFVKDKGDV